LAARFFWRSRSRTFAAIRNTSRVEFIALINETRIAVCAECRLISLRRKIRCPPYRSCAIVSVSPSAIVLHDFVAAKQIRERVEIFLL
jgi:hypothetical protein